MNLFGISSEVLFSFQMLEKSTNLCYLNRGHDKTWDWWLIYVGIRLLVIMIYGACQSWAYTNDLLVNLIVLRYPIYWYKSYYALWFLKVDVDDPFDIRLIKVAINFHVAIKLFLCSVELVTIVNLFTDGLSVVKFTSIISIFWYFGLVIWLKVSSIHALFIFEWICIYH